MQKDEIIAAIEGMLKTTLPVVNNYDQKFRNQEYETNMQLLKLKVEEKFNRTKAGELEQNLTSLVYEIGQLNIFLDNLWWENYTYNINKTYVIKRQEYLDELKNEKECQDNKVLPLELRVAYF